MHTLERDAGLTGRRVVITGAGRGLGRSLAIAAADHGADVVLLGRNMDSLRVVASVIHDRTRRTASVFPCDLANPVSVGKACRGVLAEAPNVDVLVNNGAPWLPGAFTEIADREIVETVVASVAGTILVTKGLLPGLIQSTAADIVTIVSTAGWPGWDFGGASAAFHAAKHGQSGFSDALRHELKASGIRVSAVYPPDFDDADAIGSGGGDDQRRAVAGRLTSREVVATILFVIAAPRVCAYPVIILDDMMRSVAP